MTLNDKHPLPEIHNREHNDDAEAKNVVMLGKTSGGAYVPIQVDNDGSIMADYLKLDGSNANQTINIGSEDFITTGKGRFDSGLFDASDNLSIEPNNRILTDEGGNFAVDFTTNRFLADSSGNPSIKWNDRQLTDSSGNLKVDWSVLCLYDSLDNNSIDWENRLLKASNGIDDILNFNTVGLANFSDSVIQTTGNIFIDSDSSVIGFGSASPVTPDATIGFDGNSLNIRANAVTGTDDLSFTARQLTFNGVGMYHTTATRNVFIGGAGNFTNSGAEDCIGLGSGALAVLDSGDEDFGLGTDALLNLTTGGKHTAIGRATLRQMVSGSSCTAIGSAALFSFLGDNNLAFGRNASVVKTSGNHTIVIGNFALDASSNGTTGVYIGNNVVSNATTVGNDNTIIGYIAGFDVTGAFGARNIFIGARSGRDETGSDILMIDTRDRTSQALGRAGAIIYGIMADDPTNQIITFNVGEMIMPYDDAKLRIGVGLTDLEISSNGTQGLIETTDDLLISCGAEKTLELQTVVFEDLQFPVSGARVPAANAPTWETFTPNTNEYAFGVDDFIDLQANEIPHWWVEGTNGNIHVHFTIKTAQSTGSNRFAKFNVWVAYADAETSPEQWVEQGVLTAEATIPTGSGALLAFYLPMGDAVLTNYLIGAQIKIRVKRIAATGGTEYADDVYITQVGLHLAKNTMGSRQLIIK